MGRRPNPQRKVDLLEEITAYVREHSLRELSLRPLAKSLGTSTYTLTYQFGSKEELLRDVVASIDEHQRNELASVVSWSSAASAVTEVFEHAVGDGSGWALVVLEAVTLTASHPDEFAGASEGLITDLVDRFATLLVAEGMDPQRARSEATLLSATVRGLTLDYFATGDLARLRGALELFLEQLERSKALSS